MDIQADLEFLSKQKEAAVAYAEYKAAMEDDESQHDAKSLQGIHKQDELDRTRQYVESHRNVTFNSQNFRDNPVHSNTHLGDHTSAPFIPSTHQDQMPVSGPVETHGTNDFSLTRQSRNDTLDHIPTSLFQPVDVDNNPSFERIFAFSIKKKIF
ncbi:unnamed protein product [Mytilus edulis]|uniref:Uncharacterized protein n=1 Tax=Mytilus edulis TaxID=6550 RepID=A0A8S3UH47_MYTED|nr:unnamed protein product [Mytilus edulis]